MSWKGVFLRAGIDISDNTTTYGTETDVVYRLSSALTTGTIRGLTNTVTMTAASTGNIVEAFRSAISANVKTGAWANAIVGSINYSTSGAAHGMAAAIAAEMIPPNGSLSRGALYALDVVFGCGASSTWNSAGPVAFMRFDNWGTKAHFSANAFFFHLVGETGATGGLLSLNSRTLRVRIGSTTKYLYLSDTENDLGAMAVDSITLASDVTTAITISGNTTNSIVISGTSTTALNISGATTTDIQLSEGTTLIDAAANGGSCTLTQDAIILVGGGYGKIQFGGATDWGTGATGTLIDGTGWDWVTQTVGYVTSGALATACAASYLALTVTATTHSTASSFFGLWSELYFVNGMSLVGAANAASVWGQLECIGTMTSPDSGDFMTAGYFNFKTGGLLTLTSGSHVSGVRIKGEINSITGAGILSAISVNAATTDWTYGLYIEDTGTAIAILSGGTATTGISITGTMAGATSRAINSGITVNAPAHGDGYAAHEFTLSHTTGANTNSYSCFGAWINIVGPTMATGGEKVSAANTGIYSSGSTLTSAVLIFGLRMQADLSSGGFNRLCPFSLNTGDTTITALFDCGSMTDEIGFVPGTGGMTTQEGSIPFMVDSGGTVRYIKLYDSVAS